MRTLLIFLSAVLLCSCASLRERAERAEIAKVFEADRAAHTQTIGSKDLAKLPPRSAPRIITQYTEALRGIDFSKTPTRFRVAYLEHIQAWEGLAAEMNKRPEPADIGTLLGVVTAIATKANPLTALGSVAASQTKKPQAGPTRSQMKEAANQRIRETWNKVELIAAQRGVSFPRPTATAARASAPQYE